MQGGGQGGERGEGGENNLFKGKLTNTTRVSNDHSHQDIHQSQVLMRIHAKRTQNAT